MHTYDTLEIKKGQHLHLTERFFIEKMIALGASHRRIGRLLDRPHSTINN
ncbi:helix-turn-helix domain-containing protein, partial [Acinetobacter baumannii]